MDMKKLVLIILCFAGVLQSKQVMNIKNNSDYPVDLTCSIHGHTEAILHLKKLSNFDMQIEMVKAILRDDDERIKLIAQTGFDLDQEICGKRPLFIAVYHNKKIAFKAILDCGAGCNFKYQSFKILHYVLENYDREEMACMLIEKGAEFYYVRESYEDYALNAALIYQLTKVVDALLKNGYNIQKISDNSLVLLAYRPEMLTLFLKNGLDPNKKITINSTSLLGQAIVAREIKSVQSLLEAGANPNNGDSKESFPLAIAINGGVVEIIELLQKYGARL